MKALILCIALALVPITTHAWDIYDDSDEYGYGVEESPRLQYNPYENRHELIKGDKALKYNVYENEWSYEDPDAHPQYNPYDNKWEYPR